MVESMAVELVVRLDVKKAAKTVDLWVFP